MQLSILVVDDADIIRRMIVRTLEIAGVPVGRLHEASNGREALSILDGEWVDVVLLDLNMPVMGGLEFLQRMQADDSMRQIPTIVISTESCDDRVAALMSAGVCAVVRKPFRPEQIRDAIERLLISQHSPVDHMVLERAIDEVLPTLAFMNAEPISTRNVPDVDDIMHARMGFSGSISGIMSALVPRALAHVMAANMLGTDAWDAETSAGDAVGEILNTLAGIAVTEIGGGAMFDLSPPEVLRGDYKRWQAAREDPFVAAFMVEGLPVLLSIQTRPALVV